MSYVKGKFIKTKFHRDEFADQFDVSKVASSSRSNTLVKFCFTMRLKTAMCCKVKKNLPL